MLSVFSEAGVGGRGVTSGLAFGITRGTGGLALLFLLFLLLFLLLLHDGIFHILIFFRFLLLARARVRYDAFLVLLLWIIFFGICCD